MKTKQHKKVGRPTKMIPETLKKLEDSFCLGHSDDEACLIAQISPPTLYDYCEKHPDFLTKKELLKNMPSIKARRNIIEALNAKDVDVSQWYLERKNKEEFSQRSELTGKEGQPIQIGVVKEFLHEPNHTPQISGDVSSPD